MEIFDMLKTDHKKVKKILSDLLKANKIDRKGLLKVFNDELRLHEYIEEKYLYPKLKDIPSTKELIYESFEEHHVINTLLEELDDVNYNENKWKAKLTVLKENLEHHIKEEESELFLKAKKLLSPEQIEEISIQINKLKNK